MLQQIGRSIELSERDLYFLTQIMNGRKSAYSIWKQMKVDGREIAYTGVHKKIGHLVRKRLLLKQRKTSKGIHGPVFYDINKEGVTKQIDILNVKIQTLHVFLEREVR